MNTSFFRWFACAAKDGHWHSLGCHVIIPTILPSPPCIAQSWGSVEHIFIQLFSLLPVLTYFRIFFSSESLHVWCFRCTMIFVWQPKLFHACKQSCAMYVLWHICVNEKQSHKHHPSTIAREFSKKKKILTQIQLYHSEFIILPGAWFYIFSFPHNLLFRYPRIVFSH